MTRPGGGDREEPVTTGGSIAVVNLHARVDGLTARVPRAVPQAPADTLALIDLLILRGHVLGRIADYERAAELAGQLVRGTPDDGPALLARARTRAVFHRFVEALADLQAAEDRGLDRALLAADRAEFLQATGSRAEAGELHRAAARHRPGFATLGALAVFHAERGEIAEAERLFAAARHRYQGSSPFPIASLDYRRGLMWHAEDNLPAARTWFDASLRRVPAYAPALGHRAEIDTEVGDHQAAIDRLRPLASASDDPGYAATLARALAAAGDHREARQWHRRAAARYDELAGRHPQAFAEHAADFRQRGQSPARRGGATETEPPPGVASAIRRNYGDESRPARERLTGRGRRAQVLG
jgi:tetratricopeptide (TPR) repeat protein